MASLEAAPAVMAGMELKAAMASSRGNLPAVSTAQDETQTLTLVLDWAIERLGTQTSDSADAIRQAMLKIDWQNANLTDIPSDFDPFAYLIFNADVVRAEIPPFLHYHLSGKREHRIYNWPQPSDGQNNAEIARAVATLREEGAPEPTAEPLRRLQYQYQIEGLLHAFATREREYLDEIRRLGERRGFDRAEIRQELAKLAESLGQTLITATKESAATVNTALKDYAAKLSQTHTLVDEFARTSASRNAEAVADLQEMATEGNAAILRELEALHTEQARLNQGLAERDAELKRQRDRISRYREAGVLKSLWWAIRRSSCP